MERIMKATFSPDRFCLPLYLLIFYLLTPKPIYSFSVPKFDFDTKSNSEIALFGDAEFIDGDASVKLTRSSASSAGVIVYTKPFKYLQGNPRQLISFSTEFSFSLSPRDVLAFLIVPKDFTSNFASKRSFELPHKGNNKFLGIEFGSSVGGNFSNQNEVHVKFNVGNPVSPKYNDVSTTVLVSNGEQKLQSWIDYEASSKRFEIRLCKLGSKRSYRPLISHPVDLSKIWKEEEVFVGITLSSGKSSLTSITVYSWRLDLRSASKWMHSQPLNPQLNNSKSSERVKVHNQSVCGLIILIVCCVFVGFLGLFLWRMFVKSRKTISIDYSVFPKKFEYEQIDRDEEKNAELLKC